MSEVNAIVTGAGGAAGVAVIRALNALGYQTVGVDVDEASVGLRLAHRGAVVPSADDPTFAEQICDVALRTGANLLISTVTEELAALWRASEELAAVGLAHWLPCPEAVAVCYDKWRFARLCQAAELPVPATSLGWPNGVPGPWVVKPRFGRGSRDVYFVEEGEDFGWPLRRVRDPIWQSRLTGREFTVDVLVDRDGVVAAAVPRWRLQVKAGISTSGSTFVHAALAGAVQQLVCAVGVCGPANVQGFVTEADVPVFVEMNPRFSGGLPLSLAAGADLVGEYVHAVLGHPLRPERLTYRPGVTMRRHLDEVFEG